eukprot:CAMPEP_0119124696 /NCGR_PEP_ID=MMETSP1310-20130426/4245_1 /TAXON_ID=464262 /ORGANISM="Genus nov. species nov., Strain RCC2339" /LENGTH=68 /DNA_ID=CAMNT_0007114687 /DNA_START=91 /DNA_END=294 /DNA_ORIENTATION=-
MDQVEEEESQKWEEDSINEYNYILPSLENREHGMRYLLRDTHIVNVDGRWILRGYQEWLSLHRAPLRI